MRNRGGSFTAGVIISTQYHFLQVKLIMHLKYILWNKIHGSSVGVLHLAWFKHVSFFPVLSNPAFLAPSALPGDHYSIWVWSNAMTDPIQGTSWNVRRTFFFYLSLSFIAIYFFKWQWCCFCVDVCLCLFHLLPVGSWSPWSGTPPHLHSFESVSHSLHSLEPIPVGIQNWSSKTQNALLSCTPWESFIVSRWYLCLHCTICSGIQLLCWATNNSVLAGEGSVGLMHRKSWGKALFCSLKRIVVLRGLNGSLNLKPGALDSRWMIQRHQNYFTKTSAFILMIKKTYVLFRTINLPEKTFSHKLDAIKQWFSTFFFYRAARMSFTYYVINTNQPDL